MKALILYKNDPKALQMAQELYRWLQSRNIPTKILESVQLKSDMENEPWDLVFVLGGDGTILRTARFFAGTDTPILGINFGRIGFLSSIERWDLFFILEKINQEEFVLEKRLMLNVNIHRGADKIYQGLALNDAVIRSTAMHAIDVSLLLNGSAYAHYRGDGVICATPTGSTAYSYSAGGPILDAHLQALVITPISPQLSCSRALVVDTASRLDFKIQSHQPAGISMDGQDEIILAEGDRVEIQKSPDTVTFVQLYPVSCVKKIMQSRQKQLGIQL